MDPEFIKAAVPVVNMLGTFALGVWMYLERRNDKTNERVSALAVTVQRLEKDVSAMQQAIESAPSHADLAKIYESINVLAATVNKLVGENGIQTDLLRQLVQKEIGGKK